MLENVMLSSMYSNQPNKFIPIKFKSGLNVVMAEIRLFENKSKDTHNLGKTILGRMIDYCFLSTRNPDFFLLKHIDVFENFIFYLEIKLSDNSFLTVRRNVKEASKASFKKHSEQYQDFSSLVNSEWDHLDMSFDRAKNMLDGLLNWQDLKPWDFRKGLGYQVRTQDDFNHVFQLSRFKGAHSQWKPFLAHILGFDAKLITSHYEVNDKLKEEKDKEQMIKQELGGSIEDISKIEGMLLLTKQDEQKKEKQLNAFDFRSHDQEKSQNLVDDIDEQISSLNKQRYSLNYNKRKIHKSLEEDKILFKPDKVQELFNEARVIFAGQIKKNFEQLIAFNKAITNERQFYLSAELNDTCLTLKKVEEKLNLLGEKRSQTLSYLGDTDIFNKYKEVSNELTNLRADILSIQNQRALLHRLQERRKNIRKLKGKSERLQVQVENDVEKQNADKLSLFSSIRSYFSEIVENVIGKKALLSVSPNKQGHLEFKAEILDISGKATSADDGHTYRKLLCIAFDFAVLRSHKDNKFPDFIFHDGVFESLDDRKKENLLKIIRQYASLGIQSVITLIDTDLPRKQNDSNVFNSSEIVLVLHDEGENGRLFKMPAW